MTAFTSAHKPTVSLAGLASSAWTNRRLIYQMARRDVLGRYRGSVLGLTWWFFHPLLMLAIYTFVFSTVFKARWGVGPEEGHAEFAVVLFVGLIVHGLFAECVNRAPQLVVSNVNYVKKVVFPLETLPWIAMGSALFHGGVSLLVLLLMRAALMEWIPWTAALLPLVMLPLVLATMGFSWFLAATGVFVRDIGQTTTVLTTMLLFLSPVFYPVSALPAEFQRVLLLNPLTFIIEQARDVLIWGRLPDWGGLMLYSLLETATSWMQRELLRIKPERLEKFI